MNRRDLLKALPLASMASTAGMSALVRGPKKSDTFTTMGGAVLTLMKNVSGMDIPAGRIVAVDRENGEILGFPLDGKLRSGDFVISYSKIPAGDLGLVALSGMVTVMTAM